LPELSVAGPALNGWLYKKTFVSVVHSIMSNLGDTDQELRIEDAWVIAGHIFHSHRIHVMHDWTVVDLVCGLTQIKAKVSGYHDVASMPPLSRSVKPLVEVTLETESGDANPCVNLEIPETL